MNHNQKLLYSDLKTKKWSKIKVDQKDRKMREVTNEVEEVKNDSVVSPITQKRNANKAIVKAYLETKPEMSTEVKNAIEYLAGMGKRSQGMHIASELKNLLTSEQSVSAVDIFTKFEYGRPTMEKKIRDFIKAEPSNRIWVAFENGNYVVKGTGEDAPEGWTGFRPVDNSTL